jgi:hypothetical protein
LDEFTILGDRVAADCMPPDLTGFLPAKSSKSGSAQKECFIGNARKYMNTTLVFRNRAWIRSLNLRDLIIMVRLDVNALVVWSANFGLAIPWLNNV